MRSKTVVAVLLVACGCSADPTAGPLAAEPGVDASTGDIPVEDDDGPAPATTGNVDSGGESGSTGPDPDPDPDPEPETTGLGDDPPPLSDCAYESTSFGQGLQELDVPTGSNTRLTFTVLGLPNPALIESATLRFDSYDADHPGEEGVVYVGGAGPFDLPANAAWDNANGSGTIDVTGNLTEGSNTIEFGAGSLQPRSFYRIGNVALDITASVEDCEPPPEGPMGDVVPRQIDYMDAVYTQRHNWVLRADYAFTAYGAEHIESDVDGLFDPDGSRTGTATFAFEDVVVGTYEIQIRSRHTENRNPAGALFVVDGEGIRIDQRDDLSFTTDVWGVRELGGDVTVVLDSTMENASDSVIWVRLEPV